MKRQVHYMFRHVPPELGLLASKLPGVLYHVRYEVLVAPESLVFDTEDRLAKQRSNTAYWALQRAACKSIRLQPDMYRLTILTATAKANASSPVVAQGARYGRRHGDLTMIANAYSLLKRLKAKVTSWVSPLVSSSSTIEKKVPCVSGKDATKIYR